MYNVNPEDLENTISLNSSFSKTNQSQANYPVYEIKTHHYKSEYFLQLSLGHINICYT